MRLFHICFIIFLTLKVIVCNVTNYAITNMVNSINITTVNDFVSTRDDYPLGCSVRVWNFTAVKIDINGKKCRGNVTTTACFGSCDTYEVICIFLTFDTGFKLTVLFVGSFSRFSSH